MDWAVETEAVYLADGNGGRIEIPNTFATVRTDLALDDPRRALGIVSGRYEPIGNAEAFGIVDELIGEGGGRFETAGTLKNGRLAWMMAVAPETTTVKDDSIARYLLLSTAHDGTRAVQINYTPVRVVCANTLACALSGLKTFATIRHTKNKKEQIADAKRVLGLAGEYFDAHGETMGKLADNGIPDECELLTLYAVNVTWDDAAGLFMVNADDGSLSRIAELDPFFGDAFGLAAHPDTDQLYAVVAAEATNQVPRYLATIDRATGATTVVGELSRFLCDIAFRSDGTLYGMTGNGDAITGGEIVIVNTSDASCTGTGIQRDYPQSIAFHPQSGLLYHAAEYVFETIDVDTGQVTEITDSLLNDVQALEFDLSGTTLYAALRSGDRYYIIDQTTGEATLVHYYDNFWITGMCFVKGDQDDDVVPDDCDACAGGAASGDTNGDGNVALDDYADFEACLAGPGGGLGTGCECFDFDDDGDNDLRDFAAFQVNFTGN